MEAEKSQFNQFLRQHRVLEALFGGFVLAIIPAGIIGFALGIVASFLVLLSGGHVEMEALSWNFFWMIYVILGLVIAYRSYRQHENK